METAQLRKAGLKVTQPRLKILELLERRRFKHMTADDIYRTLNKSGEEMGLATVYRVLNQFEAAGLVIKHNFEGGQAYYELDSGGHHDHMVCVASGDVVEFHDPVIEQRQREIADEHGFELVDHSLVLYVRRKGQG